MVASHIVKKMVTLHNILLNNVVHYPVNMFLRLCCRSEANASDLPQSLKDMFDGSYYSVLS